MYTISLWAFLGSMALSLIAYLLPRARALRAVAGGVCIAVATFAAIGAGTGTGGEEALALLAIVIVLSGMIIALRPQRPSDRPTAPQPSPHSPFSYPTSQSPQPGNRQSVRAGH